MQGDQLGGVTWDGVRTYKPVLSSRAFLSADQKSVAFESPALMDYVLLSVQDYLELAALIQAGVIWNRKQFFDYLKQAQQPPPGNP